MDWIEQALRNDELLQYTWKPLDLSSSWRKITLFTKGEIDDSVYRNLSDLKATFSNFAKVLGRADIEFRFTRGSVGTACAYFKDVKNFRQPVVVVDLEMLKLCKNTLDPLIGTALHEIAHILFTRQFFRLTHRHRLASGLGRIFANLLEDYRCESLLVQLAPGYGSYIQAARQSILLERWLNTELARWDRYDPFSQQTTIIASFIRFPRMFRVKPDLLTWRALDGTIFFDRVRKVLKRAPESEDDVMRLARKLLSLFPKELSASKHPFCLNLQDLEKLLIIGLSQCEMTPEFIPETEDEVGQQKIRVPLPQRQLANLCNETVVYEKAVKTSEKMEIWTETCHELRDQIACLREQTYIQTSPRRKLIPGQKRGVLDSRALYRASFDSHIFGRREEQASSCPERCTVALLLDSSGSMLSKNRLRQAFKVCVLLNEGLRSNMNVRIFSHFAQDNIVVLEHVDPSFSMHQYKAHGGNIDSQAILLLGSILQSERGNKVLFVISDGLPNHFGDRDGVTATLEAVKEVRALGIPVAGINIGDEFNETVYAPFQIHVPDAANLPSETCKLVLSELRKLVC